MDAILESLTREAGNYGRRTGEGFPRIAPEVQAARDAEAASIRQRELMPDGGGMIPTASVVQGSAPPNAAPAAPVDPIMASLLHEAQGKPSGATSVTPQPSGRLSDQIPGHIPQPEYKPPSLASKLIGGPEAALSMVTGAVAAPVAALGGIVTSLVDPNKKSIGGRTVSEAGGKAHKDILEALTYQPRSEGGKETLGAAASILDASKLAGLGPTEAMMMGGLSAGAKPVAAAAAKPAQATATGGKMASVGAAGADPVTQARGLMANASPEMQAATEAAIKKQGSRINLEAVQRHADADTLPVPVNLTKGQATQDVVALSNERNMRAAGTGDAARLFNEQNKKMSDNVHAIKELAAPDIFTSAKNEIGQLPINAYLAKDAEANAAISAKYKALKDANGGQFPLDVKTFLSSTDDALKKELKTRFVPPELKLTLKDLGKSGAMSFEDFEALRTITARIQRSPNADGNAKQAAAIIRNQLEKMPLPKGAENLKGLADEARAAAKSRADFFDQKNTKFDPVYKAVTEGKAVPDSVIQKYVINGNVNGVEKLMANLGNDATARQAIAAGVMEHLKDAAKVSTGNFSQAGYNRALEKLGPKLGVIFPPEQRLQLEKLGRVARDVQTQPVGSFVNNSNTLTAMIGETAANTAAGVANVYAHGVPVGTWVQKAMSKKAGEKALRDMIKPGAGL